MSSVTDEGALVGAPAASTTTWAPRRPGMDGAVALRALFERSPDLAATLVPSLTRTGRAAQASV